MKRKFYYHPDNEKAIGTAVIEGRLVVAGLHQLTSCIYMPKEDSEGKLTLGWWIEEWEPSDFMIQPELFFIPAPVH